MSGTMSSFSRPISGLQAAQAGLYVTGHNVSNLATEGYTRQSTLQSDFLLQRVGRNGNNEALKIGLGTNVTTIRQSRGLFVDKVYRQNMSEAAYFSTKSQAINYLEEILGELESTGKLSGNINDLLDSILELSLDPANMTNRINFIDYCQTIINRISEIHDNMVEYQYVLNQEVIDTVGKINDLVAGIGELNEKIFAAEINGGNANDLRDLRNLYLDELSGIVDMDYYADKNGMIHISVDGNSLLNGTTASKVGLQYVEGSNFVIPVYTNSNKILAHDEDAKPFVRNINAGDGDSGGTLKALLRVRGTVIANYTTPEAEVENTVISKLERSLDVLFHEIITQINDTLCPKVDEDGNEFIYKKTTGTDGKDVYEVYIIDYVGGVATPKLYTGNMDIPEGLDGSMFTEIFTRADTPGYVLITDPTDPLAGCYRYVPENTYNGLNLYTIGNVVINPAIKNDEGWSKIPLSVKGESDPDIASGLWERLTETELTIDGSSFTLQSYYKALITNLGNEGDTAAKSANSSLTSLQESANVRDAISGVSLDEELSNMVKYQHAYNASARLLEVIDGMIDRIINYTGLVGR